MDDMEIDKLRSSLRIDQRTDDKEKAKRENDTLLLRSYRTMVGSNPVLTTILALQNQAGQTMLQPSWSVLHPSWP